MFNYIEINEGKIKYYQDGPAGKKIFFEGKYNIFNKDGFNILQVDGRKYIVYYLKDIIILYDIATKESIYGYDMGPPPYKEPSSENPLYLFKNITANSYLTEGKTQYLVTNLENYDLTKPWVEGQKDSGIGCKLIFETDEFDPSNLIIIVNGYFDPQKLYLYNYNNRIKKVKIRSLDTQNEFEIIANLKDTYNLQMIRLPKKTNKLEMTILEVYKGTKYDDTCLSGLFTSYFVP